MESASPGTSSQPAQAVKTRSPGRLVVISVAGVVLLAGLVWLIVKQVRHAKARHDVDVLVLALDGFAHEHGEYPTGTTAQVCAMLRGENIDGQNPKRLDYVSAELSEMNAAGEFVDPWGTPYRLTTNPYARAYSCGPNRVDERGEGDDISSGK